MNLVGDLAPINKFDFVGLQKERIGKKHIIALSSSKRYKRWFWLRINNYTHMIYLWRPTMQAQCTMPPYFTFTDFMASRTSRTICMLRAHTLISLQCVATHQKRNGCLHEYLGLRGTGNEYTLAWEGIDAWTQSSRIQYLLRTRRIYPFGYLVPVTTNS